MTTEPKDALFCLQCVGVGMCLRRVRTLTQSTQIASCDSGAKSVCHCSSKSICFHAHPTTSASCRCQSVENPPLHTWILPSQMFSDSTLCPQTVHSCRGLVPKNRTTSSQPRFFRMSFWVTWSPSVSILIFRTTFYVISLRCQTDNVGSPTSTASPSTCAKIVFSGEQRCCFISMPNTFCFILWRALIFQVLAKNSRPATDGDTWDV